MPLFHCIATANRDRPVFTEPEVVPDLFARFDAIAADGVRVLAQATMSAHHHSLMEIDDPSRLGWAMSRIWGPVAQRLNERWQQHGGVFRHAYRRIPVETDEHRWTMPLYIHANPAPYATDLRRLDVGLRSSHEAYMGGDCPAWLTPGDALGQFEGHYADVMEEFLADRRIRQRRGDRVDGPGEPVILAVARTMGTAPSTLCDSSRGGKLDRMVLAWALVIACGGPEAAAVLGVHRHTIVRWARGVNDDPSLANVRQRLALAS